MISKASMAERAKKKKKKKNWYMESSHPVDCICYCTAVYTGWPLDCSAGECCKEKKEKKMVLKVCELWMTKV